MNDEVLHYKATDTASMFHQDDSFVRLLLGPLGVGKTVSCCEDILLRAIQQAPGYDGIRRNRWLIGRNTYPELKSTTIKTWQAWMPESHFGKIKWDSPITHHIRFNDVDLEVLFMSLDGEEDIKKLKSLELTGVYLNELQYIHKAIFEECLTRCNRYPPKKLGAPITWTGVIADTNPPDSDHWIYRVFEEQKPEGFRIFHYEPAVLRVESEPTDQPFARSLNNSIYINNPNAQYMEVQNDKDYWLKLVPSSTDEKVKVNLEGRYGIIITGKPVHPTYNDQLHYKDLEFIYNPNVELGLGWDFGLTPAVAITQLTPRGQLLVLDELWSEDMGLRDFVSNIVLPHLNTKYDGWQTNYRSRHDPAGNTASQTDGNSCQMILKEFGIHSLAAADNNDPTPRRDGLDYFLGKLVDGAPAFILSKLCKMLRKGLMGSYQYDRIKASGEDRYHEKPRKNIYSHICEGLEYIAMEYAGTAKDPRKSEKIITSFHRGSFFSR